MKKKFDERRQSLDFLLINTTLLEVNPCSEDFKKIGFEYSFEEETYIIFKIKYDKYRNIFYLFSKSI
jgi:hypothetical protein